MEKKQILITEDDLKTIINETVLNILREKGLINEFYDRVSTNDDKTLKGFEVSVFSNDRPDFTPHCHLIGQDFNIEVSLLDFNIINVKYPKGGKKDWSCFSKIGKSFFKWLDSKSTKINGLLNKESLYYFWDKNNQESKLIDFIENHNIKVKDENLIKYLYETNK